MSQLVTLDQATVTVSETRTFGPISWQIESGQKWFIAGRNGSGKSVLLELIERGGRVLTGAASGIP
ncbi:MAG TPA: ABC transporter, partial [Gammaproteobacteria bacterium]|nr:ABC transporter [Gammaproteobacteria bacterium]